MADTNISSLHIPTLTNGQLPAGLITPEFDIAALTVDELREEMTRRQLDASGGKAVLCERLLLAVRNGETPPKRLTAPFSKKKRPHTRKEPSRDEFATEAEYLKVWNRWRSARNNNNKSVKKSRETQRQRREQHETLCRQREEENQQMENDLRKLKDHISLLVHAVQSPNELTETQVNELRGILAQKHMMMEQQQQMQS
eukprot:m.149659 g.149659  ORF g.149659 m.149659 type:complete len:199 (-) comp16159_c2_seq2:97-693(-)